MRSLLHFSIDVNDTLLEKLIIVNVTERTSLTALDESVSQLSDGKGFSSTKTSANSLVETRDWRRLSIGRIPEGQRRPSKFLSVTCH